MTKYILFFLLLPASFVSIAQKNKKKEYADGYGKQALVFMDQGKPDAALEMLRKAQKLDPANINYPYEMAFAFYTKKAYDKAIQILEKLRSHKDVYSKVYQLLGNSYDEINNTTKAIETYTTGLVLFSKAPELYLELGNVYNKNKDYITALKYYEKGIEVDPKFPSNYYWAAKLYCTSTEKVWGMIYGEIFMTIERNTPRTGDISRLLYNTYLNQIRFYADSSFTVNFSRPATAGAKPTFVKDVYEGILKLSIVNEHAVTLASLCRIRKNFIEYYYKNNIYQTYPNVLFDYEYKAYRSAHSDAFTYWLLSEGDKPAFTKWVNENPAAWQKFLGWLLQYSIPLDDKYKFLSTQY